MVASVCGLVSVFERLGIIPQSAKPASGLLSNTSSAQYGSKQKVKCYPICTFSMAICKPLVLNLTWT